MKIPNSYEGKLVAIQLARPLYMFEYAAHYENQLLGQPISEATVSLDEMVALQAARQPIPMRQVQRELLTAVMVVKVLEDSVLVEAIVPNRTGTAACVVEYLLPEQMLLNVARVAQFEVELPKVTVQQRAHEGNQQILLK